MNTRKRVTFLLAMAMLLCLAGCKDKSKNRPNMDALRSAEVGSYILFGEYEQDNDESTGKEAIEWLVLDKQKDRMLVVSRYGLAAQPYNDESVSVTWETCSLRKWLNSTFLDVAFIPAEKSVILASAIAGEPSPEPHTPAGNDTVDQVFLLSIDEANRYFQNSMKFKRTCIASPYSDKHGALCSDGDSCWWWLRSPGVKTNAAAYVNFDGEIIDSGLYVDLIGFAVRPAMWIKLNP